MKLQNQIHGEYGALVKAEEILEFIQYGEATEWFFFCINKKQQEMHHTSGTNSKLFFEYLKTVIKELENGFDADDSVDR